MFALEIIDRVLSSSAFIGDFGRVRQGLASYRMKQTGLFDREIIGRLGHFVECVLASAPRWDLANSGTDACRVAAEIAELLSLVTDGDPIVGRRLRIRSALLYELAGYPAITSLVLRRDDYSGTIADSFFRTGTFKQLLSSETLSGIKFVEPQAHSFVEAAMFSDVRSLGEYEQGVIENSTSFASDLLGSLGSDFALDYTVSEIQAWRKVQERRSQVAVRRYVSAELVEKLRAIGFPSELWSTQVQALSGGLLDAKYDSWGFAAPTGTGKTFLTRLLIAHSLSVDPESIVIYLVPSRALVHEVTATLTESLQHLGVSVTAVTPQIVSLNEEESELIADSSVLVLTPEKADLLLRLGHEVFSRVSLVIVDEAHHIESETRGVLLEMYLWRIKRALSGKGRFIFLSAVAPNIGEIVAWVGNAPGSVVATQRSTRMRVGVYRIIGSGKKATGRIDYSDGTSVGMVSSGVENSKGRQLIQLAASVAHAGPVLVVAKGKKECEKLAQETLDWLNKRAASKTLPDDILRGEIMQRLDARLEREMYPEVSLRPIVAHRIAYHHAGLPPSVRIALEEAIRKGLIDFVFATTTLAEGVNFPFSTVIVQALAMREVPEKGQPTRYHAVTPRVFWNIAGRAGRPGSDREGQVILFEPSLHLEKIDYVLEDYLDPMLTSISPVRSALAGAISEIAEAVQEGDLSTQELEEIRLPAHASKRVKGAINLLRVSLMHARAFHINESPEEIYEGTFAATCLSGQDERFARSLFTAQGQVVRDFLAGPESLSSEIVAELGLSIETLTDIRDWVAMLADWQIERLSLLFYGGTLNPEQAKFVVGPVARMMSELGGGTLGGFLSEVIMLWVSGVPFRAIWPSRTAFWRADRLEDLIAVVYSRIQYLLPWGLYAADRLIEIEAKRRGIQYENQVRSLAYLADAGVPSFDALRLVSLDFERCDSARLASEYQRNGGLGTGLDIVQWVAKQPLRAVFACVRGGDGRRIDFDLEKRVRDLRL